MKAFLPVVLVFSSSLYSASSFYVAVDGRPVNDGSFSQPWDLQTALNHSCPYTLHLSLMFSYWNNRMVRFHRVTMEKKLIAVPPYM